MSFRSGRVVGITSAGFVMCRSTLEDGGWCRRCFCYIGSRCVVVIQLMCVLWGGLPPRTKNLITKTKKKNKKQEENNKKKIETEKKEDTITITTKTMK